MGDFKMTGVAEKFRVSKVSAEGGTERVVVQLGLDGLKIFNQDGNRTMNSFDLSHISRWALRGNSLVLFTKTPVDVEERQLTLQADDHTIRNVLDTLTSCCMQLAEILQSTGKTTGDKETANSLHQLISTGGAKKSSLPSVDEVEFSRSPDKAGWLQSQGEQTKFWRRRWFVLKQGYLARFLDSDVKESAKPRGIVDLSKVTDVREGRSTTGKPNSIMLKTASGSVCYIADSETEMVEWMSAIEGAVQRILRQVAGVEEEVVKSKAPAATPATSDWVKQLEKSYDAASTVRNTSQPTSRVNVDVLGYDGYQGLSGTSNSYSPRNTYNNVGSTNLNYGGSSSGSGYPQVPGMGSSSHTPAAASTVDSDLMLNYGGGYGSSQPSRPSASSSYNQSYSQTGGASSAPSYPQAAPTSAASYQQQQPYYGQQQQQASGYGQQGGSYAQPAQSNYSSAGMGQTMVSIIDQLPAQQPAYPYFQQAPQAQAPPQQPAPVQWQVLYTSEGRPYYHNAMTGTTQWEPPAGMA